MSALAHRSAAAPASTSRAGRHERRTCLVRLRLHLGPWFRSAAARLPRHAAPPRAPCAAAPPPRARSQWPSRRCFGRRSSRMLLPKAMAPAADGRTPPVRGHRMQHSNQELPSVLDALPAAPARVQRAVGQFCKSRAGICAVRIIHATQEGCAEAPRRALRGTEARDTRCGQSPPLLSCHLPHHGVRYAAKGCQYAADRASILAHPTAATIAVIGQRGKQTSTLVGVSFEC